MNSLNNRVIDLESKISTTIPNENDIITRMKKKEEVKKRDNIDRMIATFKSYLFEHIKDVDIDEDQFIKVVILTIKYVRENNHNISRALKISPSIELENESCVYFIKMVYDQEKYFIFSNEMVSASVFELSNLIYTNDVNMPTIDEEPEEKKKKKKFFFM